MTGSGGDHHDEPPGSTSALTGLMQAEIRHALDQSERNPEVIGTVLTGAGRILCGRRYE